MSLLLSIKTLILNYQAILASNNENEKIEIGMPYEMMSELINDEEYHEYPFKILGTEIITSREFFIRRGRKQ